MINVSGGLDCFTVVLYLPHSGQLVKRKALSKLDHPKGKVPLTTYQ